MKIAKPGWASRIEKLRDRLDLSQTELARRLDVSAMAISRWERGVNEPPARCYILLAKLAGRPECWFFFQRAGLSKNELLELLQ